MDLRQTAASLGLTEGTTKSHLFRGRKLLEKHLTPLLATGADGEEDAA